MIKPMRLVAADTAPVGKDWIYEVKYDGFRTLLHWSKQGITLTSRNGKDLSNQFPEITSLFKAFTPADIPFTLDGELVILNTRYQSNFPLLQQRGRLKNKETIKASSDQRPVTFMAFDYVNDPKSLYTIRRKQLTETLASIPSERMQVVETFKDIETIHRIITTHQAEGVIAKLKNSPYSVDKRSSDWIKVKNWRTISGFLTEFHPENDYFQIAVQKDEELSSIGKFKHGVNKEQKQTLADFFKEKGRKRQKVWQLDPGVCVDVNCLNAQENQMREPQFKDFRFDLTPDDCTMTKVDWDLAMFPEEVTFTNLDKRLWPTVKKREYLIYLRTVAPYMLPFMKEKKLTVIRYPDGIGKTSFFQKHYPDHAPDYIKTFVEDGETFMICPALSPLLWFGNQGSLEFHLPFQKAGSTDPDEIVLDLDPPDKKSFPSAVLAAELLKHLLDELDVYSFVKTSGNKGMQIHIPIEEGEMDYKETRQFTESLVTLLIKERPDLFTIERLKKKRGNKLYLDYVQHAEGKTIIAPYSARAVKEAAIATPLHWHELKQGIHPDQFTISTIVNRIRKKGCPFYSYNEVRHLQPIETMKSLFRG